MTIILTIVSAVSAVLSVAAALASHRAADEAMAAWGECQRLRDETAAMLRAIPDAEEAAES